ncbi:Uma2 family endonuclease [Calidithermus timidus]|jgi:Uma2 family endonuclease|uniref:Uma2 family endonuclease n=1 Tax=Calidithermus timidus TaxID=307124 RepID=UPI0003658D47|nr:Uma2 family endonuclease [Calidithermus timidus]
MVRPVLKPLSVEEYLETEAQSPFKREYVGGQVYATAGASQQHSLISLNIAVALRRMAEGRPCRVHMAEMKLLIGSPKTSDFEKAFYYPDVMAVCGKPAPHDYYETEPCILVEVLSPSTRGVDLREKVLAYQSIPSLQTYLIVDSETMTVRHFWRDTEGRWQQQDLTGSAEVPLPCLEGTLGFTDIYRGTFA